MWSVLLRVIPASGVLAQDVQESTEPLKGRSPACRSGQASVGGCIPGGGSVTSRQKPVISLRWTHIPDTPAARWPVLPHLPSMKAPKPRVVQTPSRCMAFDQLMPAGTNRTDTHFRLAGLLIGFQHSKHARDPQCELRTDVRHEVQVVRGVPVPEFGIQERAVGLL